MSRHLGHLVDGFLVPGSAEAKEKDGALHVAGRRIVACPL